MREANDRLRLARERAGYDTAAEAASAFGWNVNTYKSHENGARGITFKRALRYARAFRVSPTWILSGESNKDVPIINAPLIDWVSAGRLADPADPYEIGGAEELVPVAYGRDTLIALRVAGRSMDRVAPEGSIIIVDYEDRDLIDGKFYVIRIGDEVTFKRYRAAPARFEPYSTEPDHQTYFNNRPVEIVGRVIGTQSPL